MAEKKAAKKTTKVEKEEKTIIPTEVKCDCNCNNGVERVLKNIYYFLIALVVISFLTLVTLLVKLNGSVTTSNTDKNENQAQEEISGDYDVSMFDTLNTTDTMSKIADGSKYVVYIGRATCGYCVKFLPTLQQAQSEYGYKTIYINLEEMSSTDQTNIKTLDNDEKYIEQNLGYTPMVLIFEGGKLKNGWVGYSEYKDFAEFLEKNGYSK